MDDKAKVFLDILQGRIDRIERHMAGMQPTSSHGRTLKAVRLELEAIRVLFIEAMGKDGAPKAGRKA
jgi:hypothetical protein